MLLYPLLISNFWLYFLLPLIPLAAYANGILKSPYKKLYWLSILGLSIYSVIFSKYELFGMIIPAFVQVKSIHKAKYFYMDTIIKSAIRNELNFKFLYYIGLIKLENKITGETYSVYKTL